MRWSWSVQYFYVVSIMEYFPLVSIIILTKNHSDLLKNCLASLRQTTYPHYEVILVDNGSKKKIANDNKHTLDSFLIIHDAPGIAHTYIYEDAPFNYSYLNNLGSMGAMGEYLLFLNDDIEVTNPLWLTQMVEAAKEPAVGAVGALLYYPDGTLQHAGIRSDWFGPGHVQDSDREIVGSSLVWGESISTDKKMTCVRAEAVTGAALLISREAFDKVGGWDEDFPVAYNDVELCYRLKKAGYQNVLCTEATLIHHESATRGKDAKERKKLYRQRRELKRLYEKHPDRRIRPTVPDNIKRIDTAMTMAKRGRAAQAGAKRDDMPHAIDAVTLGMRTTITGWALSDKLTGVLLEKKGHATRKRILGETIKQSQKYLLGVKRRQREDIQALYPHEPCAEMAGFEAAVPLIDLMPGKYNICLLFADGHDVKTGRMLTIKE